MTSSSLRVLIIAGNPERAAIIAAGLRAVDATDAPAALIVQHVIDAEPLLASADALDADAILVDVETPSRATLERTLELARRVRRPIAVFVNESDGAAVQAAIDAGVSAYVVDGLRRERIRAILDVAISRFRALERLRTELEEARAALAERKIVERAKALLMRQRGLSEQQAYALLRSSAMRQNRKITDLARALIAASPLLGADDREGD